MSSVSTKESVGTEPEDTYSLHEAASGVYMLTDGNYQNMFVPTSDGVVLFDAPPALAGYIEPAIKEVTDDPITNIVYSHLHKDHIGAAGRLVTPDTAIYAEAGAAEYLQVKRDPGRPLPTEVFAGKKTLTVGGRTFELQREDFHSLGGDVMVRMPEEKVVLAIDMADSTGQRNGSCEMNNGSITGRSECRDNMDIFPPTRSRWLSGCMPEACGSWTSPGRSGALRRWSARWCGRGGTPTGVRSAGSLVKVV